MKNTIQAAYRRLYPTAFVVACTACLILVGILWTLVPSSGNALAASNVQTSASPAGQWPMGGQNLHNTRSQPSESIIGRSNVNQLVELWEIPTPGGVSATPAVLNGFVYFGDMAGNFYAANANNGQLVWSHQVSDWTGITGDRVRDDPAIAGNELLFGDQGGREAVFANGTLTGPGARLLAVNSKTGALLWSTQVESFPGAVITTSPVVYRDTVYIATSSGWEEDEAANDPTYPCCSFRGSVVALNRITGKILWKTYVVPTTPSNPGGYSGGAIWGSNPVVDTLHGSLYVGTGNNYWVPQDVQTCIATAHAMGEPDSVCDSVDNYGQDYFDSIVALDLNTGAIKWGARLTGYDAVNSACELHLADCPDPHGTDSDFAAGPNLFEATFNGKKFPVLGEGQKDGTYWALNPNNGKLLWSTKVGPGLNGRQWGTATDGQGVYVPFANKRHVSYTLQPSGATCNGGSWSALDPTTGNFLWQTATPGICTDHNNGTTGGCETEGPMSVANGVVYVGSIDNKRGNPTMFALDSSTGQILWSFASGTIVHAGPAIVGNALYWGSGYGPAPGKLVAFKLPGS